MGGKTNIPCDATSYSFRNGREKKVNTPDLNVKSAVIKIKKITNTFKKSCKECPKTMLKVAGDRGAIKRS